jgi:ABC-type transport system involved in multi-copper enzyme maturation permease subunit
MPDPLNTEAVEKPRKNLRPERPATRPLPAFAPFHLGTLVFKELHDLVLTLRFSAGTTLAILLAVLAAYIGSLDYNARLDSYQTKIRLNRDNLTRTAVYSLLQPTLVRPPEPLSVMHHGLEGRVGTDININVDREETEAQGENRGNEYLSIFSEIDLTVIVAVILGLLALLFTFDAVSGEREAGMLKLMMSYPLSRSQFLLGKYLGAWLALMLPTAMACALSLVVMGFAAHVHFGPAEIVRISLLFLTYAIYLSLMLLVGLVISSFAQRSTIALVAATLVWFFFVTIVPNLAVMIPDFIGSRGQVFDTANEHLTQVQKEQTEALKQLKDPRNFDEKKEPMFLYHYAINNSWQGLTAFECHFGDATFYNLTSDFFSRMIPLAMKYASRRADIWREYLRYRARQAGWARALAFLSPSAVFENLGTYLSGTSEPDYNHFIRLSAQYRDTFIGYLQRKGAFASWRWFTTDPDDGDPPWTILATGKTPEEMIASGRDPGQVINEWSRNKELWQKFIQMELDRDKNASRYLSLLDLPAFTFSRLGAATTLVHSAPEIAYLLVLNFILFLVAYVRFVHYDVR